MQYLALGYLLFAAVVSVAAFVVYGIDKRRAQRNRRRIPERNLHLLSLLGGWPGAFVGQRVFRHKTQKLSFQIVFLLCVILHLVILVAVFYWLPSRG